MKEENVFLPNVGKLVARYQVFPTRTVIEIYYRDTPNYDLSYQKICEINDFQAEPYFSGFTDTMRASAAIDTSNNSVLHRHFLTWSEIRNLKRLWISKQNPFDQWLKEVLELPTLAEEEKNRLRTVYPDDA